MALLEKLFEEFAFSDVACQCLTSIDPVIALAIVQCIEPSRIRGRSRTDNLSILAQRYATKYAHEENSKFLGRSLRMLQKRKVLSDPAVNALASITVQTASDIVRRLAKSPKMIKNPSQYVIALAQKKIPKGAIPNRFRTHPAGAPGRFATRQIQHRALECNRRPQPSPSLLRTNRLVPLQRKECAFVVVLWSSPETPNSVEELVLLACVLGFSLKAHNSVHDRVALVTPDFLESPCAWLLRLYWTHVQQIEHVEVHPQIVSSCRNRFSRVFTKFRALELEYKRIVLLDADLLARRNIDMLMDFQPPAALRRGHVHRAPGKVPPEEFLDHKTKKQRYGINIGVCLLEPSQKEFNAISKILMNPAHPENIPTSGPEQDFITRRYMYKPGWTGLHMTFNFQLHQLIQANGKELNDRNTVLHEDVNILHYSSDLKPCDFLFQTGLPCYSEFMETFLRKFKGSVDDAVRERIDLSIREWYQQFWKMWRDMLTRIDDTNGERTCKWCKKPTDVEHFFITCPRIQPLVQQWRSNLKGYSATLKHLQQLPPGTIAATLNFVGAVYKRTRYEIDAHEDSIPFTDASDWDKVEDRQEQTKPTKEDWPHQQGADHDSGLEEHGKEDWEPLMKRMRKAARTDERNDALDLAQLPTRNATASSSSQCESVRRESAMSSRRAENLANEADKREAAISTVAGTAGFSLKATEERSLRKPPRHPATPPPDHLRRPKQSVLAIKDGDVRERKVPKQPSTPPPALLAKKHSSTAARLLERDRLSRAGAWY